MTRPLDPALPARRAPLLAALTSLAAACALAQDPAPAGGSPATPAAPPTAVEEAFARTYHDPVPDPRRGSLYPLLARLLDARMEMLAAHRPPDRLSAPQRPESALPDLDLASTPEALAETLAAAGAPPAGDWLAVLSAPAVEGEKLAFAFFMARRYDEAARVYEDLLSRAKADAHLTLMLALCRRNQGRAAEARALLDKTDPTDAAARGWAEWLARCIEIEERREKTP